MNPRRPFTIRNKSAMQHQYYCFLLSNQEQLQNMQNTQESVLKGAISLEIVAVLLVAILRSGLRASRRDDLLVSCHSPSCKLTGTSILTVRADLNCGQASPKPRASQRKAHGIHPEVSIRNSCLPTRPYNSECEVGVTRSRFKKLSKCTARIKCPETV